MKTILIVEDDESQSNALQSILLEYNDALSIFTAQDINTATYIFEHTSIDLFLLDIDLDSCDSTQSGIDIGLALRSHIRYCNTPIIYITGIPELIHTAINDIHCFNYIQKPYKKEDVFRALNDIMHIKSAPTHSLQIHDLDGIYITVPFSAIRYLQFSSHTLSIHSINGSFDARSKSVADILNKLPTNFVQIHRSYIVNIDFISAYDKTNRIVMINNIPLSVGRSFKVAFEEKYLRKDVF